MPSWVFWYDSQPGSAGRELPVSAVIEAVGQLSTVNQLAAKFTDLHYLLTNIQPIDVGLPLRHLFRDFSYTHHLVRGVMQRICRLYAPSYNYVHHVIFILLHTRITHSLHIQHGTCIMHTINNKLLNQNNIT